MLGILFLLEFIMSNKLIFLALVAIFVTSTSTFAVSGLFGGGHSAECKEACKGRGKGCLPACTKYQKCRQEGKQASQCGGKFRPEAH